MRVRQHWAEQPRGAKAMSIIIAGAIALVAITTDRNVAVTGAQPSPPAAAQLPAVTFGPDPTLPATPTPISTPPAATPSAVVTASPTATPMQTATSSPTASRTLAPTPTPEPTPAPTPAPQRPAAGISTGSDRQCEPSYPDFCVALNSADLDCKDIAPRQNFKVKGDDPHRFDADNDGLGCEPYYGPDATPKPEPKPTKKPGNKPKPDRNCDPSYPTLCLPSSPDLDCSDLRARRFPVRGRDPHGFDGDGDGVGCESG